MKQLESRKGILGYTETQAELAKLSALKADVDDYKGKTLNEISRIVTDINQALKEKKNKLAPQIKELRTVRLQYQVSPRPSPTLVVYAYKLIQASPLCMDACPPVHPETAICSLHQRYCVLCRALYAPSSASTFLCTLACRKWKQAT